MFSMRKLMQAIGASILITVLFSFIIGFFNIPSFNGYIVFQMILTYVSLGYFSVKWNPKTPYTAAFLGATIVSILSILTSYFLLNVLVLWDPAGIGRSMTWAVLLTLLVAIITVYMKQRKAGTLV
ncbi:hypothetical protein [Paenisporosarcina sp. HGH0030]|uniref:hypothetical protein n=2 Tax=unclassified Paenisporosarcina TaxID=2642018 RepID=UPI0011CA69C6|nr:hypothetical protein [Paenisporosarcina sp. HGH0030]